MNAPTFIVLAVVVVALIFAIRYVAKNGSCGGCSSNKACHASRKNGGGGSCSSCSSCHACSSVHPSKR